jgi:hypothetical protein
MQRDFEFRNKGRAMIYELQLVNPKTGNEKTITVFADRAAAEASPDWQAFVQNVARPEIPAGYMPTWTGVREVTKQ